MRDGTGWDERRKWTADSSNLVRDLAIQQQLKSTSP